MDGESKEVVVLGMINQGVSKFDRISRKTNVEPKKLEVILHKLENSGRIRVNEKKGWFGTKIEINPTEEGYREFERQLKILQQKWNELENTYKSGNKLELDQKLKEDKSFLPSMIMFGIIDMMMFSMMFSMIGTSMENFIPDENMQGIDNGMKDNGEFNFGDDGESDIDIGF